MKLHPTIPACGALALTGALLSASSPRPNPAPAPAGTVTIDFDNLDASGGPLLVGGAYLAQGVLFQDLWVSDVSGDPYFATGPGAAADTLPNAGVLGVGLSLVATATFVSATTGCPATTEQIEFDVFDTEVGSQLVKVTTYDLAGQLLGVLDLPTPAATWMHVIVPGTGIHAMTLETDADGAGLDNLTFATVTAPPVPSVETVRLGTPPNPQALLPGQTSGPVIGQTWDPIIDHATFLPAAVLDLLGITAHATNLALPPFGTLLCDPTILIAIEQSLPGQPFAVAIPSECAFVGVQLCTQGASVDALGDVELTNALDITLGNV